MIYDLETLNIFIYAFFAVAAIATVLSLSSVAMLLRRPAQGPTLDPALDLSTRPALGVVRGVVREHPAMASRAPLPHERAA